MQKYNLINKIEEYAPLELQAAWDFSGIQIESTQEEISHVAVMLDPTIDGIKQALAHNADFILTHHPLALSPYTLAKKNALFYITQSLIKHDALLYSAHTSLDAKFNGFSSWLAKDLDLQDIFELDSIEHFGTIGSLQKPISLADLCAKLVEVMPFMTKSDFRLIGKDINSSDMAHKMLQKIAFCTGSGSGLYHLAKEANADIFITGDVKYHTALDIVADVEASTFLLDVGHFSLEEEMMRRFSQHLAEILPIKVTFISSKNPFITIN